MMIPIAKPLVGNLEAEAARRPIESGWLTQGVEVRQFETEFADYVGAPFACAVSNCTTALHLALLAVGVRAGDEVVTASHSFIATANVVRYCGAIPVFVDVDPRTFNVDPALVERAITPRTRAILAVHQMGMPCDTSALLDIARRRRVPLIEDAACAVGSEIQIDGHWERVGKPHGDIACFSFHPRKVITTGDGGMLTTANPELDRLFRLWRQHAMSVPDAVRHGSPTVIFESYPTLGYNYRMTDVQAAIGREQLKRLPGIVESRRVLAARYQHAIADVPGLRAPHEPTWARSNWQSYCVRLAAGVDQRAVMQRLLDHGISTRRGIMCAHGEPAYRDIEPWSCGETSCGVDHASGRCGRLGASESAQAECVLLPLYAQMTEEKQAQVIQTLFRVLETFSRAATPGVTNAPV